MENNNILPISIEHTECEICEDKEVCFVFREGDLKICQDCINQFFE